MCNLETESTYDSLSSHKINHTIYLAFELFTRKVLVLLEKKIPVILLNEKTSTFHIALSHTYTKKYAKKLFLLECDCSFFLESL